MSKKLKLEKILDLNHKGVNVKTALWAAIGAFCGYLGPRVTVHIAKKYYKVENFEHDKSLDNKAAGATALACGLAHYYDSTHDLELRHKS